MSYSALASSQWPLIGDINGALKGTSISNGPTVSLSTTSPMPSPGSVIEASWSNPVAGLKPIIRWLKNGLEWYTKTLGIDDFGDSATIPNDAVSGDEFQAQVWYTTDGTDALFGTSMGGSASSFVTRALADAHLVRDTAFGAPTAGWVTKAMVEANKKSSGSLGPLSNTITVS